MKKAFVGITLALLPGLVFATGPVLTGTEDLLKAIGKLVGILFPLTAGIALLYFFWGLAEFILKSSGGDEKARAIGKNRMVWGVITLFVMVSVWGLVAVIQKELGLNPNQGAPTLPTLPGLTSSSRSGGGGPSCPPCSNFPNPQCPGLPVC